MFSKGSRTCGLYKGVDYTHYRCERIIVSDADIIDFNSEKGLRNKGILLKLFCGWVLGGH